MTEKVKNHDFVELEYTGKLADGTVFDTTSETVAREQHLHGENRKFEPSILCVGENQVLPGLDAQLVDKEVGKEYTVTLPPEQAFGKRDIKNMKIVPMSTFKEHNMNPQPGLQINVDGELGTVARVAGGRVIVNFNHPLAGKEVRYTFKVLRKIADQGEQIISLLQTILRLPKERIAVDVQEGKAAVTLPMALPSPVMDVLQKKLQELTKVHHAEFTVKTGS